MSPYERPVHQVVLKEKPFEVRFYETFYVVTYSVEDGKKGMDEGFRTLFRYISKNNKSQEKISMTVPVLEEKKVPEMATMSFMVPRAFGDAPPEPIDPRLKIKEMTQGYYAVITYRGRSDDKVEMAKETLLEKWIADKGYKIVGPFRVAYYAPPFLPGFLRVNEVWVEIEGVLDSHGESV